MCYVLKSKKKSKHIIRESDFQIKKPILKHRSIFFHLLFKIVCYKPFTDLDLTDYRFRLRPDLDQVIVYLIFYISSISALV